MAYSVRIVLRKYKPNSMGYHILQLCVTKNSSRKRISLKLYVDPAYWDNSAERLTIERNLKGEKQREANKKRIQDNAFLDKVKARAREMARRFGEAFEALSHFRGVSIAAINGYAMGGGLECALACDIRIAERQAQMALPEATVGLLPCAGGTQNLPWLVGEGWAKRMILCGERIDAETALRIGLVEQVVDTGEARGHALLLAARVARQSPVAVRAIKPLIQGARSRGPNTWLPEERERFVDLFDADDTREGVNAFLEKRDAQWCNK